MRFLLVQQNSALFTALREVAEQRIEGITPVPVVWQSLQDTVDLEDLIDLHEPSYILFSVQLALDSDKKTLKQFRQCFEYVERTARKFSIPVIFISSAMVFEPSRRQYQESDQAAPQCQLAQTYLDCEKLLEKKAKKHIILRTSWLYSALGDNFVTCVIQHALEDEVISFNSAAKGCPTAVDDLARVIVAMLLQLELDAEDAWGIYHYCSSDPALGFQFVEAIVAQASQFDSEVCPKQLRFEHNEEQTSELCYETVMLSCEKILADFGIHQKPWRSQIAKVVKRFFENREVAA
jgi:dTDP-4-dehydrorhamnose reductase